MHTTQLLILFLALLLSACAHTSTGGTVKPPRPPAAPNKTSITSINLPAGKIVLVNADLRYVVVDFGPNRRPRPEQKLNIYREGQKVGEITVSAQARDQNFAADIVAGEIRVGDDVREQ